MLAAQIQNLPPIVPKAKKRRRAGGWPHEPTDDPFDPFGYEAMVEREAEVELGALVKEAQDEISALADEMSVEVDDLDTSVMVESPHVFGSSPSASHPSVKRGRRDDDR